MVKEYTDRQDWIEKRESTSDTKGDKKQIRIGLSAPFIREIGPIVWIDLPSIGVELIKDDTVAAIVESTKAAVDILAPVSGTVIEINKLLLSSNGMHFLNEDPEGDGWLYEIQC